MRGSTVLSLLLLVGCPEPDCPEGFEPGDGNLCLQIDDETDTDTDSDSDSDADSDSDTDSDADTDTDTGTTGGNPVDDDGDGFDSGADCDDTDPMVHPDAVEVCDNGVDDDCDPATTCRWSGTMALADAVLTGDLHDVTLGDLTGDAQPDLLVAGMQGQVPVASIVEGVVVGDVPTVRTAVVTGERNQPLNSLWTGDLTGDGAPDLLAVAYDLVYLLPGPVTADVDLVGAAFQLPTLDDNDLYDAASIADVDGDGVADLLVGGPYAGPTEDGQAFLLFGPITASRPLNNADTIFQGGASDQVGRAVSLDGDFDGDGTRDPVIAGEEVVRVYDGGALLPGLYDVTLQYDHAILDHEQLYDRRQVSVGDMNADGYADLAVGARGEASVVQGPLPYEIRMADAHLFITDTSINTDFGEQLSLSSDLDGDSYDDLVVTETGANQAAHVFYGIATGTVDSTTADAKLLLAHDSYDLVAGDLDRDGFQDVGFGYGAGELQTFLGGGL